MQHKKFKKIIFSLLALLQIFTLNFNLAFAQGPVYQIPGKASQEGEDIGSDLGNTLGPNLGSSMSESFATGAAETLEKRYNLNLTSIQDQGQNFNVMGNKMMGPQVLVNFNPASPKPNDTVTATASPLYFGNDSSHQYFTWYLKHKGCDVDAKITKENKFCDADGNGTINENDWKVEAARIVAGNGFDWRKANNGEDWIKNGIMNTKGKYLASGDGATAPNGTDGQGDGYKAYIGGEDQKSTDGAAGIGTLNISANTKTFICDLLILVDADKKIFPDLWKTYIDQNVTACKNYSPPATTPSTPDELAAACLQDQACTDAAIANSVTAPQDWANGCRNSIDPCSDHTTPVDGTIGCNENGAGVTTTPNPEQKCWDASANEESNNKELNTLASNCQNDTNNDNPYSCLITASLIKYYGLNYQNLFDRACDDATEKDCAAVVFWKTNGITDNITACFHDATCPTTALKTALTSNSAGQALLAQTCSATPDCSTTTGNGSKALAKMQALLDLLATLAKTGTEIINNLPQYEKEIEAIQKQLQDMPNLLTNAVDIKNFEQVCKGKQSDAGVQGWLIEQVPAQFQWVTFVVLCWDQIWAQVQPILDQITSLLNKMGGAKAKCYIHDFSGGEDYELPDTQCYHQFPKEKNLSGINTVGDAHYGRLEELFFHTNPEDTSTADNGQVDEANVAGKGQNKISWDYQAGDQVGVIVEGVYIMPSKYDDATQKVMWAMPKNILTGSGNCKVTIQSPIKKMIKGYEVLIPSARYESDPQMFTECLAANLLDPQSGGQEEKIDVGLSYSPKNPVNNSADDPKSKGDNLVVQASILSGNVSDKASANFTWSVSLSTDSEPNEASWCVIPENVASKMFKQNTGKGLDTLTTQLNYKSGENTFSCDGKTVSPADAKLLKVAVNITDNTYSGIMNEGNKSIVIPVFSDKDQIEAYTVSISESGTDTIISSLALATKRDACGPGESCPVIKNDIIGVKVDPSLENYSWELDGKPFTPVAGCGSTCQGSKGDTFGFNTDTAFFPITKNPGEKHIVTMNAEKGNGEKVKLSKTFNVIEPTLKFNIEGSSATGDEYQYVYQVELGQFTFPDGTVVSDMSPNEFNVTEGTTIKLTLQNYPSVSFDKIRDFSWKIGDAEIVVNKKNELFINEVPISSTLIVPEELATALAAAGLNDFSLELNPGNNTKTISFTVGKKAGEVYPISASGVYTQPDDIKMALFRNWGIQMSNFYENDVDATMNLTVESVVKTSMSTPQKVIATIFSSFPSYLGFLLKLALNTLLILFATWLILSFLPKKNEI